MSQQYMSAKLEQRFEHQVQAVIEFFNVRNVSATEINCQQMENYGKTNDLPRCSKMVQPLFRLKSHGVMGYELQQDFNLLQSTFVKII
jgi:hypothetical protein